MTVELPEFAVVESRPCDCGCTTFVNFFKVANNIGGKCRDCGETKRWFSRHDLGLAHQQRSRRGSIDRSEALARWHHRCAWCGISAATLQEHGEELVVGHIVPHHALHELPDIQDHPANLAASCNACNDYAHKIGRELFDLSILLHAAVAYAAGKLGVSKNERRNDNTSSVRPEIRLPGLASIPVSGERQAALSGKGTARGDDG